VGPLIFPTCVATPRPDRHNQVMGRKRSEQTFPDLFSTDAVRDASTPPPPATKDATAQPEPHRHVLPKNLRTTVKHLNDEELHLLHAATLEEIRQRGRLQQNVEADSAQTPRHAKRSPIKDKISQRRRVDIAETTLTARSDKCRPRCLQGGHHTSKNCATVRNFTIERAEGPGN
jgi:hypothetical protein